MKLKNPGRSAAVIDIGSNILKMRISQVDSDSGKIHHLDTVEYPVKLGHEVFSTGKISFESIHELSTLLKGFSLIIREYGISRKRIVGTTALREAHNSAYVRDQLKIQNDMNLEILDDAEEKSLIFKSVLDKITALKIPLHNLLLSYIGTGTIGMAQVESGDITYCQNIALGTLKLSEMLREIQDETAKFHSVIDEYLNAALQHLKAEFVEQPEYLVLCGNEMPLIAKICDITVKKGIYTLSSAPLLELYHSIRTLQPSRIALRYGIEEEQAESLYAAVALYVKLTELTGAKNIIFPLVDLWDELFNQMLFPQNRAHYYEHIRKSALSCARRIATRYQCDLRHGETVASIASLFFDKLKKIHGLSQNYCLLLELAAYLHNTGYYVNSKNQHLSSYYIIKNCALYGLTDEEILIVAQTALYNEEYMLSSLNAGDNMPASHQLIISKLSAILRLANALDKAHKSKIAHLRCKLDENKFYITASSQNDLVLEKWAFYQCADFFEEVLGLTPELISKTQLLHAL